MKTIRRYTIPIDDETHIVVMDANEEIRRAEAVITGPTAWGIDFWVEHNLDATQVQREFQVFGTGHHIPETFEHRGTTQRLHGLVWHLYEHILTEVTL